MEDEPIRTWRVAVWTLVVLFILLAYVLSIGPVVWLDEHDYIWLPCRYFYAPVIFVATRGYPTWRIYALYMRLWGVDECWFSGIRA